MFGTPKFVEDLTCVSVAEYPEGHIVLIALLCLIPMTAYATYRIGSAFIQGR
jgi:hypothetical protein